MAKVSDTHAPLVPLGGEAVIVAASSPLSVEGWWFKLPPVVRRSLDIASSTVDVLAALIVIAALTVEFGIVVANVFTRTFLHFSLDWSLEGAQAALMALTFVGGAVAYSRDQHVAVRVFVDMMPASVRTVQAAFREWLV